MFKTNKMTSKKLPGLFMKYGRVLVREAKVSYHIRKNIFNMQSLKYNLIRRVLICGKLLLVMRRKQTKYFIIVTKLSKLKPKHSILTISGSTSFSKYLSKKVKVSNSLRKILNRAIHMRIKTSMEKEVNRNKDMLKSFSLVLEKVDVQHLPMFGTFCCETEFDGFMIYSYNDDEIPIKPDVASCETEEDHNLPKKNIYIFENPLDTELILTNGFSKKQTVIDEELDKVLDDVGFQEEIVWKSEETSKLSRIPEVKICEEELFNDVHIRNEKFQYEIIDDVNKYKIEVNNNDQDLLNSHSESPKSKRIKISTVDENFLPQKFIRDPKTKRYLCHVPECPKSYKGVASLKYHIRVTHAIVEKLNLNKISEDLDREKLVKSEDDESYPRRSKRIETLTVKVKNKEPQRFTWDVSKRYPCLVPGCTKRYKLEFSLKYHINAKHSNGQSIFERNKSIKLENVKLINSAIKVPKIEAVFSTAYQFPKTCAKNETNYQDPHTKRYPCSDCPKDYAGITALRYHLKVMHSNKKQQVEVQTAMLPKQRTTRSSQRTENLIPSKSLIIDPKFHLCQICNKEFKFLVSLTHHLRQAHPEPELKIEIPVQLVEKKGEKTFLCPACNAKFSSKTCILNHVEEMHPKRYVCPAVDCKKSFTLKLSLRYHICNIHPATQKQLLNREYIVEEIVGKVLNEFYLMNLKE